MRARVLPSESVKQMGAGFGVSLGLDSQADTKVQQVRQVQKVLKNSGEHATERASGKALRSSQLMKARHARGPTAACPAWAESEHNFSMGEDAAALDTSPKFGIRLHHATPIPQTLGEPPESRSWLGCLSALGPCGVMTPDSGQSGASTPGRHQGAAGAPCWKFTIGVQFQCCSKVGHDASQPLDLVGSWPRYSGTGVHAEVD